MYSSVRKMLLVLLPEQRKSAAKLFLLLFVGMGMEVLSVGMIVPMLNLMTQGGLEGLEDYSPQMVDHLNNLDSMELLLLMAAVIVVVFIIRAIVLIYISWVRESFIADLRYSVSNALLSRYLHRNYEYHINRNSSALVRNVMTEATKFSSLINQGFVFLSDLFVVVALLFIIMVLSPVETATAFTLFAIAWLVFYISIGKRMVHWGKKRQESDGMRLKYIRQGIGAVKEIILNQKEREFVSYYQPHNLVSAKMAQYRSFSKGIPRVLFETTAVLALIVIVVVQTSMGQPFSEIITKIGLFAVVAFRILPSANRLASGYNVLRFGHAVIEVIFEDLMLSKKVTYEGNESRLTPIVFDKSLILQNLNFSYPDSDKLILNDLSLEVFKGETIGIIGKSGEGKSTLVDAILGLLKPKSGKVMVDGADTVSSLCLWHKKIGYVPQSVYILDETLEKNIAFGVPNSSIDSSIVDLAISQAHLADLVKEHPLGIQMMMGEDGVKLSGGQRQRIGIARALYKQPDILILDEATSALDVFTESQIVEILAEMQGKMTIFIISHRESTLEICDRIFRLSHGQLSEIEK